MNSAAMRENTIPTNTPAIEDNSRMNPANGLIAIEDRIGVGGRRHSVDHADDHGEPGLRLAIRRARCWFVQSSVREGWVRLPEARVFFGLYHPRELV